MTTDDEIRDALDRAAAAIAVPIDGAEAIVQQAFDDPAPRTTPTTGAGPTARRRSTRQWLAYGGAFATAAAIVVIALVVTGGPTSVQEKRSALVAPNVPVHSEFAEGATAAAGDKEAVARSDAVGTPVLPIPKTTPTPVGGVPAKVVSTGTLRLGVTRGNLERDVAALRALATGAGGYVSSTNVTERGQHGGGTLELAVPASTFPTVIAGAEKLGATNSLVTKAADVTKAYSDTAAQIHALTDVRGQLEALLAKTGKVSDLLEVEQQIESVQSQIDVLESEQSTLSQEVTYARLTVDLVVAHPTTAKPTPRSALDRAWSKAVSGFTGSLRWLLSISGVVLFILLLGMALIVVARLVVRRLVPRLRRYFL